MAVFEKKEKVEILNVGKYEVELKAEVSTNPNSGSTALVVTASCEAGSRKNYLNINSAGGTEQGYSITLTNILKIYEAIGKGDRAKELEEKVRNEKYPTVQSFLQAAAEKVFVPEITGTKCLLEIVADREGKTDNKGYIKLYQNYYKIQKQAQDTNFITEKVDDEIPF